MTNIDRIAAELHGKRNGNGWLVRCPFHNDRSPSLSIDESANGQILVHCFAGCSQESVIAALRGRGLWPPTSLPRKAQRSIPESKIGISQDLVAPPSGTLPPQGIGEAKWVYRGAGGEALFIVERIDTPQGKQFRPWSWDRVTGVWVNRAWPTPRPLYGLDHLAKAPKADVLIVEGEKSAVAARKIVGNRYVVVTWPNGAKSVSSADWTALKGRMVLVWPDADQPGLEAAQAIGEILRPLCPEVKVIDLDLNAPDAFTRNSGFDAADALGLEWDFESFRSWSESKIRTIWKQARFDSVAESLRDAQLAREAAKANKCATGIRFLDKALGGGIAVGDVLLLAAPSGAGKTETALFMATHNAAQGKRVHVFALEAERYELTQRLLYRELARLYFEPQTFVKRASLIGRPLNFCDWMDRQYGDKLKDLEEQAEAIAREKYKTLNVYYRDREFGIEELRKQVLAVKDDTDLVVCDHVGYVDLEGENENRAMTELIKAIRDIALISQKPHIIISHIRKRDTRNRSLLPDLEDVHGTSNLGKIATKAVMLAPCFDPTNRPGEFFTYMRVVKNRRDGSRCRFTAVCTYDAFKNAYKDEFILGRLSADGQKFEPLKDHEMPYWVKD